MKGYAVKHESQERNSYGEYQVMFLSIESKRNKNKWVSESPNKVKMFKTKDCAAKALRRTGQWWNCEVVKYEDAVNHCCANAEHSEWEDNMDAAYYGEY